MMTKIKYLFAVLLLVGACGKPKDSAPDLKAKKKELTEARKQLTKIQSTIKNLEEEIQKIDPSAIRKNVTLVSTITAKKQPFEHRIEVRGNVQSRQNIQISAQVSGMAEKISSREGQRVKKGQLLLSINADVLRNQIAEYKTALELATVVAEKREQLWSKRVGTEIQYLQAKNEKESLERKLATARSQLRQTRIVAPFSGTIEKISIREGELVMPGAMLLRMTSPQHMYLQADVSEKYIGQIHIGDDVKISFPTQGKDIISTVKAVGQVINKQNRTFEVEVKMPKVDFQVSPNQVAILQLRNYYNEEAWVVPTQILQQDKKGQFIFCVNSEKGSKVAKKTAVEIGKSYQGKTEVTRGLVGGEQIVDKGFRELTEGNEVRIISDTTPIAATAKK